MYIRPSTRARILLQQFVPGRHAISPLFGLWSEIRRQDRRLTRNFRVNSSGRSYKLIEIRPDYQADERRLAGFSDAMGVYASMTDTGRLPMSLGVNEVALLVEWLEGPTLQEAPPRRQDVEELAACLLQTYRRMDEVPNHLTRERLRQMAGNLSVDCLISADLNEAVSRYLDQVDCPDNIWVGRTFGDVSPKNFLRFRDGKIFYIDLMGIVGQEPMIINLEKMAAKLDKPLADELFDHIDDAISGVKAFRSWSKLARILQVIRSKSSGSAMANQPARRRLAQAAIADLETLLS